MKALELFEYLATNSRYSQDDLANLLVGQDEVTVKAFKECNNLLMRKHLSNGALMADKTTVFQI